MFEGVDSSWIDILENATSRLTPKYKELIAQGDYIPKPDKLFSAFKTLAKGDVKYILFGQDPYPREQSAIGYAFIDGAVSDIFSPTGLSTSVNKATSLRNFLKMLLVASAHLDENHTSQSDIARLDKADMISTIDTLRINFEKAGVLLLNTSLLFTDKKSSKRHIKEWKPFIESLLEQMIDTAPKLILFGNHAKEIKKIPIIDSFQTIDIEHPYNTSFIKNKNAHSLFMPMRLLEL